MAEDALAAGVAGHPANVFFRLRFANVAGQGGDLSALRQARALLPDDKKLSRWPLPGRWTPAARGRPSAYTKDLVTTQPNSSSCRYHFAMALARSGERAQAEEQFRRALELNPPPEERECILSLLRPKR